MKKMLIVSLLLLVFVVGNVFAQSIKKDSIIKIATADAQNFQLNKSDLEKFRIDRRDQLVQMHKPSKMFDRNYQEQVRTQKVDYTSDNYIKDTVLPKDGKYTFSINTMNAYVLVVPIKQESQESQENKILQVDREFCWLQNNSDQWSRKY